MSASGPLQSLGVLLGSKVPLPSGTACLYLASVLWEHVPRSWNYEDNKWDITVPFKGLQHSQGYTHRPRIQHNLIGAFVEECPKCYIQKSKASLMMTVVPWNTEQKEKHHWKCSMSPTFSFTMKHQGSNSKIALKPSHPHLHSYKPGHKETIISPLSSPLGSFLQFCPPKALLCRAARLLL